MFTNEWFHLVSDITLSITCNNQDKAVAATRINNTFQSNKWQVKFALSNAHLVGVTTTVKYFNLKTKVEIFCVSCENE